MATSPQSDGIHAKRSLARAAPASVAAALVLVAAACGGSGSSEAAAPSTSPATPKPKATTVAVSLSDEGCSPDRVRVPAGTVIFEVENTGSKAVTEAEVLHGKDGIMLGERENVVPGVPRSFTLDLPPGRYDLFCPNGTKRPLVDFVVTGSAARPGSTLDARRALAVSKYKAYVLGESALLLAAVDRFASALEMGNLRLAKAMFGPVRFHYETIEPIAESFGDLDPAIDARVNDVADRSQWTGFHRIEQILWQRGTTRGTEPYARRLQRDVETLNSRIPSLDIQPAQLANGAVELLDEVASSKITGEEDRYSHTDLSDFQGNLTGAKVAFDLLRPVLVSDGHGELARTIDARFADVQKGLDAYRRQTALGFALYGELTPADRRELAAQIDALAEPLSTVAAKVACGASC